MATNSWRQSRGMMAMIAGAGLCVGTLSACKKEAPPPPPPPKAPPPAPSAPPPVPSGTEASGEQAEPVKIDTVLAAAKSDPRVQFPQDVAPSDGSVARAIVDAANALAKGNDGALRAMLQPDAQLILDGLVNSGDWETSTKRIEGVRVIAVNQTPRGDANATGFVVQMAVQEPGEAYVIAWEGAKQGMGWKLTGAKAPAGTKPRASDWAEGATAAAPSGRAAASAADVSGSASMLASLPDEAKVLQGLVILLADKWAKDQGLDMMQLMAQTGQQLPPGIDKGALDALGAEAKTLVGSGVMPDKATFKSLVDVFALQPGVTKDKIFGDLAGVTGVGAAEWTKLYGGEATEPQFVVAPTGAVRAARPMQLALHVKLTSMIMVRSKNGAPLPAEVAMGMSRKYKIDGVVLENEIQTGNTHIAARKYYLPPAELRAWVDDAVNVWGVQVQDVTVDEVLEKVSMITGRSLKQLQQDYKDGK